MSESLQRLPVLLCGHGTRHADGAVQFVEAARLVRAALPGFVVSHAFMELSEPLLPDALEALYRDGARRVLVMPCMLLAAGHAKIDIPLAMREWNAGRPEVKLSYGGVLGVDEKMLCAAVERIEEALAILAPRPRKETVFLCVGRGSSDSNANADVVKIMRLLWERLEFGWGETAFFDVTFPRIDAALAHAATMGFARVVVLPYLLFAGVLTRRLEKETAAARAAYPGVEFVLSSTLGAHDGVIATIVERTREALASASRFDHAVSAGAPADEREGAT